MRDPDERRIRWQIGHALDRRSRLPEATNYLRFRVWCMTCMTHVVTRALVKILG